MGPRIRKKESPWSRRLWVYWSLALHTIFAPGIVFFMLYFIDGVVVNYNSQVTVPLHSQWKRANWQADTITTAVSALMVAIRLLISILTTAAAWRCALILLETRGITLEQFNRTISWPAYLLRGSSDAYMATLILLLLVPANIVSPVLTGSVGWKDVQREAFSESFQHTGPMATDRRWYWYSVRYAPEVEGLALSAASRAGVGWLDFGKNGTRPSRLVTSSRQRTMPVNSTIGNLTLPFLEIHSISWDKKSDFEKNLTDQLTDDLINKSKITLSEERPFNYYHFGNAVLFDEEFLRNYPKPEINKANHKATTPPPAVFRGVKKIAVLVTWQDDKDCSAVGETIFGSEMTTAGLGDLHPSRGASVWNCFLIGTVNFTAGVIRKQGKYITPRVIEADVDNSASVEGDNWVIESLYLLPDVMVKVSLSNASQIPTWDNLNGYVEDLIRISYQATWGQVASQFNASPLNLTAHISTNRMQAVVSRTRVIWWYSFQFLALVSAVLLRILQSRSNRPAAVDVGVVALLVDAAPVLNKYDATEELSRMSYITECDGGTVQLVECDVPDSGEQVRRRGGYDRNSGEMAPLAEHGRSSASAAKPQTRFMLVPQADGV